MTYGDLSIISRAVLVLLRQVRAINVWIHAGYELEAEEAVARIREIDAMLAEIAEAGARHIEAAQDGQGATQ